MSSFVYPPAAAEGADTALSNITAVDLSANLETTKASALQINHLTATYGLSLSTANNGAGNSGGITLTTGTATGTRGGITLAATTVTVGATSSSLIPAGTSMTSVLGFTGNIWASVYSQNFYAYSAAAAQCLRVTGATQTVPSGASINGSISNTNGTPSDIAMYTLNSSTATASRAILVETGNNTSTGATGVLSLRTGDAAGNASGNITLTTGTASTTRGEISFNSYNIVGKRTTAQNAWGSDYYGLIVNGSNSDVSSNQGGGVFLDGDNLYLGIITRDASVGTTTSHVYIATGYNSGAGASGDIVLITGNVDGAAASGAVNISTGNNTDTGATAPINLSTGNSTASTAGDINLTPGSGVSESGKVVANGRAFRVPTVAADPATPANGDVWYNTVSNELKVRANGSTVVLA